MICDINYALTKGSVDHAIHLARQGLKTKFPGGLIPHLQSLLLGYLAYCLALSGKKDEALAAADKSAYLRKQAGGTYYQMVTKMILGAVYTQLNLAQKAESTLSEAIKESKNLSEMFVRVSAYAHRAILRLNHHRINDAIADVRSCLTGMKNRNYIHFHTWHPALMQKILTTAITNNIEIDYSQKLANKRLTISITPAGEAFPILKIITLGRFELKLKDKVIANYKNFSTIQRELLALLVSSPKTGLSLETIQVIFWPESLPQKVRSKLDNLLARLRKVLNSLLTPYPASLYISTEKGFLRLHNCCVDVEYFMQEVQNGLSHLYRKNSCQANTAFLKAHYWYKGNFMPRVNLKKHAYAFHEKLQHFYLKSTYHWAEILSKTQRYKKAIAICQKALTCDPTHQPLVKFLYHLYTQYLNSDKASEIINNYKKALICEGFSQTEIDVIMNNFWRH
jgi:DNA-binding SARP family transcriptional activator